MTDEITQEHEIIFDTPEEPEIVEEESEETPDEVSEPEAPQESTLDEVVDQVLRGEWGIGQDRRLRLQLAGHNPNQIQRELVRRANSK